MNHDKYSVTAPETGLICDLGGSNLEGGGGGNLQYDETDLLSKMFTKDHQQNRSGYLHMASEGGHANLIQISL
jgi:hypothetical protein